MFLTAWLFWTTLSCWSLSEVSSLPPASIDLDPPNALDAEPLELSDEIPVEKRFIRYMFRPPTFWTTAENMSPDGQKRGYEKNFLRFGRNNGGVVLDEDVSPIEDLDQNDLEKKSGRNFLRFGREAEKKNRNFLRFGRDRNFLRFGRAGEALASDVIDTEELEAAKRSPRNFLRFGRASDKNFLRFGRDRNFLRFGRSVSELDANDNVEKSLSFGESAVAPSSSPSSPVSQITDSSSSSSAESKKRSPRGKRSPTIPFIYTSPDNALEIQDSKMKRPDTPYIVFSGPDPISEYYRQKNTNDLMNRQGVGNAEPFIRFG